MHKVTLNKSSFNKVVGYLNWINEMPVDLRENADFEALEASIFDGETYSGEVLDAINETGVLEYPVEEYPYYLTVGEDGQQLHVTVDLDENGEAIFEIVSE